MSFSLKRQWLLMCSETPLQFGTLLRHHSLKTRIATGLFLSPRKASLSMIARFSLLSDALFLSVFYLNFLRFLSPFSAGLLTVKRSHLAFIRLCGEVVGVGDWWVWKNSKKNLFTIWPQNSIDLA